MDKFKTVKHICVFGAGSAGWISAFSLANYLPDVEITLAHPSNIGNIGVGESTQPSLVELVYDCGLDEEEFMRETDATLKHGIYYRDWYEYDTEYWHPFTSMTHEGYYTTAHLYHKAHNSDPVNYPLENYYSSVHPSYAFCVKNNVFDKSFGYAYHINSDKLASYLHKKLQGRITYVKYDNVEINVDKENNEIKNIICDGQSIVADLYVDCSGFNRVLYKKLSGAIEDNYEGNVNCAIACQIPYASNIEKFPYTRADAWENGWVWTIPLQSRVGSGVVFNTNFCSVEEAKSFFKEYWEGHAKEENMKVLPFSSSCLKNPWNGNVVAVGLSAGFVEPLEATGIAWFILGSKFLAKSLSNRGYDPEVMSHYNSNMCMFIKDVQDFIDVHYMLSKRRDSEFWKYQTSRKRNNRLMNRLEIYKNTMPTKSNRSNLIWAFNDISWIDILTAYHFKMNTDNIK